jgi:hypothetical protein
VPERHAGGTDHRREQDERLMSNSLYERDFHAWTMQQAELLRARRLDCADLDNIAEEIEDMGKSVRRELTSRLAVLFVHLLKWQFQPTFHGNSWRLTIKEQRLSLRQLLRDNPSLKSRLKRAISDAYARSRIGAQRETGLAAETFPETCPFTFDQAISDDFWPGD